MIDLSTLKENPHNPRFITDEKLEELKESLTRDPESCAGMELDPRYCQVAVDRICKFDEGIEPIHIKS